MFKTEKRLLNYACFKHPWVLEVMSMSVEINEKMFCDYGYLAVFLISQQLFLRTPFFPEHFQWVLPRIAWTLITAEKFNNSFIRKNRQLSFLYGPESLLRHRNNYILSTWTIVIQYDLTLRYSSLNWLWKNLCYHRISF